MIGLLWLRRNTSSIAGEDLHRLVLLVERVILAFTKPCPGRDCEARTSSTSMTMCSVSPGRTGRGQASSAACADESGRGLEPAIDQHPHGQRRGAASRCRRRLLKNVPSRRLRRCGRAQDRSRGQSLSSLPALQASRGLPGLRSTSKSSRSSVWGMSVALTGGVSVAPQR